MATAAQTASNCQNAQKSTSPKTDEGIFASSMNNFRHGLAGKWMLTPDESLTDFEELHESLKAEHQPTTATELLLVERMVQHYWMSQRAMRLQAIAFDNYPSVDEKQLALYLRYQTTHDRAFHKCLSDFLKLRKEKRQAEMDEAALSQRAEDSKLAFESQRLKTSEEGRKLELNEARVRSLNAKSAHQELETDTRAFMEARLPGHTQIPFSLVKSALAHSLEELGRELDANPELAAHFKAA